MIIKEFYKTRHDGIDLYLCKSDEGYYIRQMPTNILYNCAIDVENAPYTYEETDQPIKPETDDVDLDQSNNPEENNEVPNQTIENEEYNEEESK